MAPDVRFDRVSKRYRVPRTAHLDAAALPRRASFWAGKEDFWAVRDVSFDVARGQTIGIIGRNGAGKSTLLKLLTGITVPTAGEITIRGRLAAMIEVGSGFHPELTGRENVYLSGSILGLRRRDITARLASIVEFAGIGQFLDVPVKFYSSGMYVRLGFAIAAHLEPDVLVIDEVLAVGDREFQGRCFARIDELKKRGTTMLLVSHDLGAVEQLCEAAILLDRGRIAAHGTAADVVTAYQRLTTAGAAAADVPSPAETVTVESMTIVDAGGQPIVTARTGEPLMVRVAIDAREPQDAVEVVLSFYDFDSGQLLTECAAGTAQGALRFAAGRTTVEFAIPRLLLGPGSYTLGATARPFGAAKPVAWRFGRTTLYVSGQQTRRGPFQLPYDWRATATPVQAPPRAREVLPHVSIVIPCYRQAQYLPDAIESVLAQEYRPFDVVVVDDGSPDDTAAVAARYEGVRCVRQENGGLASARNFGFSVTEGEFVVFLDADDRLLPDALAAGARHLRADPALAFVAGRSRYIAHDGAPLPTDQHQLPEGDAYALFLQRNRIRSPAAVMFRRSAIAAAGLFESGIDACADYDMYLRLARVSPMAFHDAIVAEYRRHPGSMSQDEALMLRQLCEALRRQRPFALARPAWRAAWHAGYRDSRRYYGDRVINRIRYQVRTRRWTSIASDLAALAACYPTALLTHAVRKTINAGRKKRGEPPLDEPDLALRL